MKRLCLFLLLLTSSPLLAQQTESPPPAFSMVEAKRFAGVLVLGALAYTLDEAVRTQAQRPSTQGVGVLNGVQDLGDMWGQPGVVASGLVLWGGGLVAKRPVVAASGLRAIEAITVSSVVTYALKETTGRARPRISDQREDWQLLRGTRTEGGRYESMPSGHATAAFAFATAVTGEVARHAPEHARWVGIATYTAATATAYARIHHNRHWLSDVTVGAGIGTVTALAITRWHATRPDNVIDRWLLRPEVGVSPFGGARVGVRMEF